MLPQRIVLEAEVHQRGIVVSSPDAPVVRIREEGKSYREPRCQTTFDQALEWLAAHGYEFERNVGPKAWEGHVKRRYVNRTGRA